MINVLINAYACNPHGGSEPGMTWNWISRLSKFVNLFVITEGEWRQEIETELALAKDGKNNMLDSEQASRIHFYFNPVSQRVRDMCWNQGDWRFYYYYHKWQKSTLKIAKRICADNKIDIIHQLGMICFREPGLLWKIDGPKFVWGPLGAMTKIDEVVLADFPFTTKLKQHLKQFITTCQLRYSLNVRKAFKKSDYILAALPDGQRRIKEIYGLNVEQMIETGLTPIVTVPHSYSDNRPLELLWVGRFLGTKRLSLALKVLSKVQNPKHFHMHIIGSGSDNENQKYKQLAVEYGVDNMVTWHGFIPHDQVIKMMCEKDIFFFTSVNEGGPHVIFEAIATCLPVICYDACGMGVVVDETMGYKIPIGSEQDGIKGFVDILNHIDENRKELEIKSSGCIKKQLDLSWDTKINRVIEIYEKIVNETR